MVLARKESVSLLLDLSLLLLELLLLQVLDLGVDTGDGVRGRRSRWDHLRGGRSVRRARRVDLSGLAMHHSGSLWHHGRSASIVHDGIRRIPLAIHHRLCLGAIWEAVEVELHAIANGGHVEKMLEVIIGTGGHVMIMTIPGG
jgi:hypothetical protein